MNEIEELKNLIARLTRLLAIMEDQVMIHKELSILTIRQLNYLDLIRSFENPKVSDLAGQLGVSKPTVAVALKGLIDKGYVKKMQSSDDKRVFNIELTKSGKKINRIHDRAHEKIVRRIFDNLNTKEIKQFRKLLEKVMRNT